MAKELVSFINATPTAFHAVHETKIGLKTAGFVQLPERETWKLALGGKYYLTRNHSTPVAFAVGKRFEAGKGFLAIGAHTNSPRPKVKPVSKTTEEAKMSTETLDDTSNQTQRLTITRPDDWHLHLRDGNVLPSVVPHSASTYGRAIIMPNLKPPVTTVAAARAYQERILSVLPSNSDFNPLMTLYLTDVTTKEEIKLAKESGVVLAMKLYPAGATTNSEAGVTDLFNKCMPVLEEMAEQGLPLLVHGEVADPNVDIFDRERVFIEAVLTPLVKRLPHLKIVMEHITTQDAVDFIQSHSDALLAATVTPQHLLLNRNAIFKGGLQPHNYCLPVLKREKHRQALVAAVTSGRKQYFLGTDSAPHERHTKEASCGCAGIYSSPIALPLYAQVFEQAGALDKFEAFASFNGPLFYGLPRNTERVTLARVPCKIPTEYSFGSGIVVPLCAGETLEWSLECQ